MSRQYPVVAIDGPAGAGKSTVSRKVAEELDYLLLDTGALYRSVALSAMNQGIDDAEQIGELAQKLAERGAISFQEAGSGCRVLLDGEDVTVAIRAHEMGLLASRVSAIPAVRQALLQVQRAAGEEGRVVVEGRDIGSVVFPDAEAKFFLTASVETRAARRFEELKPRQPELSLAEVETDVRERDRRDSNRPVAPLVRAEDARLLDSTDLGVEQVVLEIVRTVREIESRLASES